MKNYQIKKIKQIIGNNILNYTENGAGMFVNDANPENKKHIMDFFAGPNEARTFIMQVIKKPSNIVLNMGTNTNRGIIQRFFFDNKVMMILTAAGTTFPIEDVTLPVAAQPAAAAAAPVAEAKPAADIFTKIEEKLLRERPLRITILKKRPETPEQFLIRFFKEWNEDKDTIYADDKSVQTVAGKRRSLGDIFLIMKYYYPTITVKEVMNLLVNALPRKINDGFRSSWCNQTSKKMFYYDTEQENGVFDKTKNDEWGNAYNKYVTALS